MRTDVVGQKFGMLTIVQRLPRRLCICQCECGSTTTKRYDHVVSGRTSSCGCAVAALVSVHRAKHGDSRRSGKAGEFTIWAKMRQRCENPNEPTFKHYGGRGIRVCERWQNYEAFLADMGRRPTPDHQIERKDNNGNYEPSNCVWATRKEQCRNRRSSRYITAHGIKATAPEWQERTGIKASTILARVRKGWTPERAVAA